jgi:hypothetical protein
MKRGKSVNASGQSAQDFFLTADDRRPHVLETALALSGFIRPISLLTDTREQALVSAPTTVKSFLEFGSFITLLILKAVCPVLSFCCV